MILLVDNYDSFTYNLADALGSLGRRIRVVRNDAITPSEAERLCPEAIVISPGPGKPRDAGVTVPLLRRLAGRIPVLGVCLGHQALAEAFGGKVVRAPRLVHGESTPAYHRGDALFQGLPNPFEAGRYHSLIVREKGLPERLEVTSWTSDREVMGLRLKGTATSGVQFHPESILTPDGERLLRNFLMEVDRRRRRA